MVMAALASLDHGLVVEANAERRAVPTADDAGLPALLSRLSGEDPSMFDVQQWRDEAGQGLAEYALILALIAIIAIVALIFLGTQISSILSSIGAAI
jgi:pilus assembly protein Flp/PilA